MLIEVKDLEKGDEILVPLNGHLLYIKLLRKPVIRYKKDSTGARVIVTSYYRDSLGETLYKAVKGSVNIEKKIWTLHGYTHNIFTPICSPEGHNTEKYFNLNHKQIWLVNRL